jgi:endonuclease YncB( thermonuclease family)
MGPILRLARVTRSLALLALFAAVMRAEGGDTPPEMPSAASLAGLDANVIEVLDGDSLVLLLDGELRRFEVLGADAPEWREQDPEPSEEGLIAKLFLTRLLQGERVIVFEPEPGVTDPIGRRRGYVFRMPDGLSVDLEIVRQGYGKVSTRCAEPFEAPLRWYESRAKELERGVWARPSPGSGDRLETPGRPTEVAPARVVETVAPSQPEPNEDHGRWVWITKSGSKYHREDCQHLRDSRTRVDRKTLDPSLSPCQTCRPDG